MSPLLELDRLDSGYGGSIVVRDVSLAVAPGEIFALIGKNGMGKTTLLRTIMGFVRAQAGTIRIGGTAVGQGRPHRIARMGLAYAPQEAAVFQDLGVAENLRLALRPGTDVEAAIERATEAFPILRERRTQKAGTLSGGEQKMLLVARALAARPRLMLLDEITEGLQPSVVDRLAEVLRAERAAAGTAMLVVEQNVAFALRIADRFAVLKRGEVVDSGAVAAEDARERIEAGLRI